MLEKTVIVNQPPADSTPTATPLPTILTNSRVDRLIVRLSSKLTVSAIALGLIILLGAFLRFYRLGADNIGNAYYAATVQSMLTSWHNFFFGSFEPGGSVTVDKPPLGLWVQAFSASILGINGFALALPQALAGVLSIPLLYTMVKRQFGQWAGLIAALVLAVTPVTVSTERNNTMDGLLLFVLLLATWAFLRAVRDGRFRYLLLGALLVGLGFNIKMLQAYFPLPALYALYLFGAPHSWTKRFLHLSGATVVLVIVSLSWAVVVDLTPPENRPYIGSSEDNTVMELIFGHNGLRRLFAGGGGSAAPPADGGQPGQVAQGPPPGDGQPGQFQQNPPPDDGQPGQVAQGPPSGDGQPGQQPPDGGQQGGRGFSHEVGVAGATRLFIEPLSTEAGWLLPLALMGIPLVLVMARWRWPLSEKHLALLLWIGWLLPELFYFSFTSGLFHAYYLLMLGPPMAAIIGATGWALNKIWRRRAWLGWTLLAILAGVTLAFQSTILRDSGDSAPWIVAASAALLLTGLIMAILTGRAFPTGGRKVALVAAFLAVMIAPLAWSAMTAFNPNPDVALPRSGPDDSDGGQQQPQAWSSSYMSPEQERLLDYLLANTDPDSYLVATNNAREASPYILETGRPVLTFGGFTGGDNVVNAEKLAQMVTGDELRYVLSSPQQKRDVARWLYVNCTSVAIPGVPLSQPPSPGRPQRGTVLYDCGGVS